MRRTIKDYILNPKRTFDGLIFHLIKLGASFLPDELYLKLCFKNRMSYSCPPLMWSINVH